MLHFCTSKTSIFGTLLHNFLFLSKAFLVFVFTVFFVCLQDETGWQFAAQVRDNICVWVCVRVQPRKTHENMESTYPPWAFSPPPLVRRILGSQENWFFRSFPVFSLQSAFYVRSFLCGGPASAFWVLFGSSPWGPRLVHGHKLCACVWVRGLQGKDTAPVRSWYCFDTFTRVDLQQHLQNWNGSWSWTNGFSPKCSAVVVSKRKRSEILSGDFSLNKHFLYRWIFVLNSEKVKLQRH